MRSLRKTHSSHRFSSAKSLPSPAHLQRSFNAGEAVPVSGVYRVTHTGHRPGHEVSMVLGESFPKCRTCVEGVRYELIIGEGRSQS